MDWAVRQSTSPVEHLLGKGMMCGSGKSRQTQKIRIQNAKRKRQQSATLTQNVMRNRELKKERTAQNKYRFRIDVTKLSHSIRFNGLATHSHQLTHIHK